MGRTAWRLVTLDIDGTLTTIHGWRYLARTRGREPEYDASVRRIQSKEIGEDEHLRNLLRLAEGLPLSELPRILESTPKLAGIQQAVSELHGDSTQVALLTHNPDYVCRWYCGRFGFDGFSGFRTPPPVGGRIPRAENVRADKLSGLRELLVEFGVDAQETVHVGDAPPDALIYPHVGGGIAVNSEFPEVDAAADRSVRLTDLRGLVPIVRNLPARPTPNGAPNRSHRFK